MSRSNAATALRLYVYQHVGNTGLALPDRRFLLSGFWVFALMTLGFGLEPPTL
jgi:hypothetical protein